MAEAHREPRILVIVHEDHAGLGRLGELESALRARVDLRRPDRGQALPTDLGSYDALVVLGGSMAAWQDDVAGWLPRTRRLLAEAVEREIATLGICLGAQLLALATGGQVHRGDRGLEVGLSRIQVMPQAHEDPFFGELHERLGAAWCAAQWHQDAVTALPPGAQHLAVGEQYPHQGFRIGTSAWGVQYHPEVSAQDWAQWMRSYDPAEHPHGASAHAVNQPVLEAESELARVAQAHVAAFAVVLRERAARTDG